MPRLNSFRHKIRHHSPHCKLTSTGKSSRWGHVWRVDPSESRPPYPAEQRRINWGNVFHTLYFYFSGFNLIVYCCEFFGWLLFHYCLVDSIIEICIICIVTHSILIHCFIDVVLRSSLCFYHFPFDSAFCIMRINIITNNTRCLLAYKILWGGR